MRWMVAVMLLAGLAGCLGDEAAEDTGAEARGTVLDRFDERESQSGSGGIWYHFHGWTVDQPVVVRTDVAFSQPTALVQLSIRDGHGNVFAESVYPTDSTMLSLEAEVPAGEFRVQLEGTNAYNIQYRWTGEIIAA